MRALTRPCATERSHIRELLDECLRRRSAGERVEDGEIIVAHPDLMPALARELRLLRILEGAGRRARDKSTVGRDLLAGAVRPAPLPASDSSPPQIGGYRLLGEIHRGCQGVVYQAVQESTRRTVAIKVQRQGPFSGERDRLRFDREVDILSRMRHPNIVTIHDKADSPHGATAAELASTRR